MPTQSISRGFLAVLLATIFASAAHAQIALNSTERQISAQTSAFVFNVSSYNTNQVAATNIVGDFDQSFTQGASLSMIQMQTTISQHTSLTASPSNVLFGGTLHLTTSLAQQYNIDTGAAGAEDVNYHTEAGIVLNVSETVNFTLVATTSHSIQFGTVFGSSLTLSGGNMTPVFVGDSSYVPSGPTAVNLSGTLAPGQYRVDVSVSDLWPYFVGNDSKLDDRTVDFLFQASAVIPPSNRPNIDSATLSGTNFVASGSGGVTNGTYYVLSSTNVALSLTNWTVVATNGFDDSGHFAFTNAATPIVPQRFYLIRLP